MSECCSKKSASKLNVINAPVAESSRVMAAEGAADFTPWEGLGKAAIAIHGMWCASCSSAIETALRKQRGVSSAAVSFASESARIEWDPNQTSLADALKAVQDLGYAPSPIAQVDRRYFHIQKEIADLKQRIFISAPLALWVLVGGWISVEQSSAEFAVALSMALSAAIVFCFGGGVFLKMAWRTLKVGVPGMDFLVSLGAGSALFLSFFNLLRGEGGLFFDATVFLVLFLLLGRLIEHLARRSSANVLHTLLAESPPRATVVKDDDSESRVSVEDLPLEAKVRIRAGERVPVDGEVESGAAHLDKSLITGESAAELVEPGSKVFAGSINLDGDLFVRSLASVGERRIDAIAARMEALLAEQSSYEALTAVVARYLVLVVLGLAALTAAFAWLSLGEFTEGVVRAIAVVVVTCPCALGLATPLALLMSSNRASALGLSFRDGETLEQLANVDVVFFDKTGTLTKGELRVCGYVLADGVSEEELFEAAAIAETGSLHPIAKAISSCVELRDVPRGASKTVAGYGVEWTADATDAETLVGSASFLSSRGVEVSKLVDSDTTTVHVARNSRWLGALLLDDELRADAATTVSALRAMGLEVAMLTGDISKSALRMAKEVGLAEEEVHYELSPEGKADLIGAARDLGKRVAFVGEGLNDGPALAAANVGIAAQGSCDLALRSAPLVIQHGGIGGVVDALRLSRQTLSIMRQNLGFALIYNVTAIPVAALGFLQPIWAGAAMVASSLSVTFNSLRIKTIGGSKAPW